MKKVSLFIFTLLITISFLFVNVSADNKRYTTESVEFDVFLTEDGDAEITENWVVNYEVGEFTRFRKNIYMDLPREEKFSNIEDLEVEVDGEEYELTLDGSDRPEGKYSSSYSNGTYTYEVYFRKSEERVNIEVSYVLKDVVKCVDDGDYYLFVYRFLPNGYKDNIEDFSINIETERPHNSKMKVLYKTKGSSDVALDTNIDASNVSDMFKVKLRIDGHTFGTLSSDSYLENEDIINSNNNVNRRNKSRNDSVFAFVFTIIVFTIISFIIFIIIFNISKKMHLEKKYRKEYLENPDSTNVSLTLPKREEEYTSNHLFAFFDGLIPEGWLLNVVAHNWKMDRNDRFGILLVACHDPIGNVSIREVRE